MRVALRDYLKSKWFRSACHYDGYPVLEGFVGAIDAAVPCAMLLNLVSTMTPLLRAQVASTPELSVSLVFFDGEEALKSWSSSDSLYGSNHLSALWDQTLYWADEEQHCQNEEANHIDRMDVLFLLDLIGTPAPDFQKFKV
jgi:glutaminyl-peptide cyclotransferase